MSIAVVTDSTSDIEPGTASDMGIDVVPLIVRFGDRSFRDYVDLSRAEFYRMLSAEKDLPSTSQPAVQMFEQAFRPHVESGAQILCLTISSKLSGAINAARAAAAQFPGAAIEVVDSQTVAGGLRLQVLGVLRRVREGRPMKEIVEYLDAQKITQRLYACIPDLSHAVRSGRIGKAKAALGTLMKIVPVIALRDGEVVAEAQVRTLSRARETMIDLALAAAGDIARARFLIMHTDAPELADDIEQRLRARLDGARPLLLELREAGPAIAAHAGPGAVGIFCARE